jgi:hypothetical protein
LISFKSLCLLVCSCSCSCKLGMYGLLTVLALITYVLVQSSVGGFGGVLTSETKSLLYLRHRMNTGSPTFGTIRIEFSKLNKGRRKSFDRHLDVACKNESFSPRRFTTFIPRILLPGVPQSLELSHAIK